MTSIILETNASNTHFHDSIGVPKMKAFAPCCASRGEPDPLPDEVFITTANFNFQHRRVMSLGKIPLISTQIRRFNTAFVLLIKWMNFGDR